MSDKTTGDQPAYNGVISKIKANKRASSIARTTGTIAVLAGVLFLGIGIGDGRIAFGADAAERRSIQKSDGKLSYDGLDELYGDLRASYDGQLDTGKLEDGLKEGLVKAAGDPYTEYFTQEEYDEFNQGLTGTFEGIGAELNKEGESIVIISPIAGSPAERAGIKAKDIISKINGESAYDIKTDEAVKKIRGPKGTSVTLDLVRDGKPVTVEIVRDQITSPSVKTEITPENIGIMTINRFGPDTEALAKAAAADFKAKNVKGVVLDMRGNGGGLLDTAVEVSSLWLPKGKKVLEEKRDDKVIKTYNSNGTAVLQGIPTVVLLDEGSASASEITAGALKDNGSATIIGTKSYGKGSVQELRELNGGGVLKVTIARWFTPNGRNIDKDGIEPDQKVEFKDEDAAAKRDPQKDAAIVKLKQ